MGLGGKLIQFPFLLLSLSHHLINLGLPPLAFVLNIFELLPQLVISPQSHLVELVASIAHPAILLDATNDIGHHAIKGPLALVGQNVNQLPQPQTSSVGFALTQSSRLGLFGADLLDDIV